MRERIRPSLPEIVENGYLEHDQFELNGAQIDFMGVSHSVATLKSYGDDIRTSIEKADGVLPEYAPIVSGVFDEEYMRGVHYKFIRLIIENETYAALKAPRNVENFLTFEQFWDFIKNDPTILFYQQLEEWAWQYKKPLYLCEPILYTDEGSLIRRETMELLDAKKAASKVTGHMAAGGILYLCAKVIADAFNNNPILNRRALISGVAAAAVVITAESILSSLAIDSHSEDGDGETLLATTRTTAGPLVFNREDQRDVSLSAALDIGSAKIAPGTLAAVYGVNHVDPARHYGSHTTERWIRSGLYKQVLPSGAAPLSIYERVDGTDVSWKLKESIETR